MGRKRLPPEMKRHDIHITLPKYLIDELKGKNINISQFVQKLVENYLKMKN